MEKSLKKGIVRQYDKMLKDVAGEEYYKGKVNCYVCQQCERVTKTIDRDSGITPMGIECPYCSGDAMSTFYEDRYPNVEVTHEWVRPTLDEVLQMAEEKKMFSVSHILNGGLIRRKING